MTNLIYLGIALVFSLIGCGILWLRNRRPTTMEASIKDFSRELGALAPDDRSPPAGPRAGGEQDRGRRSG
ncbi:MAG TPA: hypothetical protein VM121_07250 [Acidimicrobiales bacterium]|nr:hypothetical protein [Acidimicrobiales bacterium]